MRTSLSRPWVTNTRHALPSTVLSAKPRLCRRVRGSCGALADRASSCPSCHSWNTTRGWCLSSSGASFRRSSSSSSSGCRRSRAAVWARCASSRSLTSSSVSCHARAAAAAQATTTSASTVISSRACNERGVRVDVVPLMPAPAECGSPRHARFRSIRRPACGAGGRCALPPHCC